MNIFDYIKNYAYFHGWGDNYTLKSKFLTKKDILQPVKFSNGTAFFYRICAVGEIQNYSNLSGKFLELETPTDFWDLSGIVNISDFGTVQKAESDFIFAVDNVLNFKLFENTAESMFANIQKFYAQYFYLTPLPAADKTKMQQQGEKLKIKFDINKHR